MRLIILLLATLLIACGSEDKPANLIEQDKMSKILADVHEAEAHVNNMHLGGQDSSLLAYQRLRWKIMKQHQTDTATFRVSLKYYIMHPPAFKAMYEDVKIILENRRKAAQTIKPKKVKRDTLKAKSDTIKKVAVSQPVKQP
ncbi:DUF4296 domain-containing protein [Arcicella sp. DC2W]|uniref:DUF4296 domain-containing protein n=1 Tax=Arcicella gelida TaxID=2984195 RepID=A0ABU5S1D1_9BACT|nr:DUF4296 domain-containing protein [Arcicella sp. DC2W]MEA5402240.1 DUF4296 domain-containing protein [Arcicella sp. DC2W]